MLDCKKRYSYENSRVGAAMTDVVHFLQYKDAREEAAIARCFAKSHSLDERLDALLAHKALQVDDHKLFLAFLAYLEQQGLEASRVFYDVVHLPKHQFEAVYAMCWAQVVKLGVIFLTILRENDRESYEHFAT